jgi:hypothetical protein
MEEDPTQHIGFREEYPFPIGGSERGKATIECTGLDREPLNEARRDRETLSGEPLCGIRGVFGGSTSASRSP